MLTVGNYKMRDGRDVKIVAVVDGFAVGYRADDGPIGSTTWDASNGRYFNDGSEDSWDIIDDKPRIKREAWLTIYDERDDGIVAGGGYATKEQAMANRSEACIAIARVPIDFVRGENLT